MDTPVNSLNRGVFSSAKIWAVLLLAGFSGYMSLSLHGLLKDQVDTRKLLETMTVLKQSQGDVASNPQRWLVDAYQKLPQIERLDSGLTDKFVQSLGDMEFPNGTLAPHQRIALQMQMSEMLVLLRQSEQRLVRLQGRYTQFYYWSLIGFLLSIVILFTRNTTQRSEVPLYQILHDRFPFPHVPLAMSLIDNNGCTLRVNRAFEELTGYCADETE